MDKIVLEHVDKVFKTRRQTIHALSDISLSVPEKSIVAIVGPSGCGKSTIVRLICDIIKPTAGDIYVDGYRYERVVPKQVIRKMGFIFQRPNLLPWLTIRENIQFPQKIVGLKGKEWDDYVNELIEIGRLTRSANRRPTEVSGGMLQRAGVLRAMSIKPEILLMDEPFGALDDMLRERLNLDTLEIWEKLGQTIVFITHNVREAVLMSSKVYVMATEPGRILEEVMIDLPYPRELSILADERFIEYERRITSLIGEIDLATVK
jgi:NitT/TauT family transport system ATP-binding protein